MLAYYFYQAGVKNWLWTVIFSIILTDDRFPSLGFHPVCVGDKRKNRCPECLYIIFHDIVDFFGGAGGLLARNIYR